MAAKRQPEPRRSIKDIFLVICEGDTERNYIDFLRKVYHSPIRVITKVEGQQITQQLINKHIDCLKLDKRDRVTTFIMYDLYVEAVNQRFRQCQATLLLSNPCIELWFLLHSENHNSQISSDAAINALKQSNQIWEKYKKGVLTFPQQSLLWQNRKHAIVRAKALESMSNPSSSVYLLLEKLEASISA